MVTGAPKLLYTSLARRLVSMMIHSWSVYLVVKAIGIACPFPLSHAYTARRLATIRLANCSKQMVSISARQAILRTGPRRLVYASFARILAAIW